MDFGQTNIFICKLNKKNKMQTRFLIKIQFLVPPKIQNFDKFDITILVTLIYIVCVLKEANGPGDEINSWWERVGQP